MTRRLRDLLRRLPAGWRIDGTTGSGHLRLVKPGYRPVITSTSPSDQRSWRNVRAQVRRHERTQR